MCGTPLVIPAWTGVNVGFPRASELARLAGTEAPDSHKATSNHGLQAPTSGLQTPYVLTRANTHILH